jgi:hypothetical protein
VFDGTEGVVELEGVKRGSALDTFLRAAFPIPFPSAKNMNYI